MADLGVFPNEAAAAAGAKNGIPVVGDSYFDFTLQRKRVFDVNKVWVTQDAQPEFQLIASGIVANGSAQGLIDILQALPARVDYLVTVAASDDSALFTIEEFATKDQVTFVSDRFGELLIEPTQAIVGGKTQPSVGRAVAAAFQMSETGTTQGVLASITAQSDVNGGTATLTVSADGRIQIVHDNNGGLASGNAAFQVYGRPPFVLGTDFWAQFGVNIITDDTFDDWGDAFWGGKIVGNEITTPFEGFGDTFFDGKAVANEVTDNFDGFGDTFWGGKVVTNELALDPFESAVHSDTLFEVTLTPSSVATENFDDFGNTLFDVTLTPSSVATESFDDFGDTFWSGKTEGVPQDTEDFEPASWPGTMDVHEDTAGGASISDGDAAAGNRVFGQQAIGAGPTADAIIFIQNIGTGPVHLGTPTLSGTDAGEFGLDTTGFVNALNPGQSTTFEVFFDPTAIQVSAATVNITTDDPAITGDFTFDLSGEGIA